MRYILLLVMLCNLVGYASAQVTKIDTVNYLDPIIPKKKNYNFNTDYWYTIAIRAYSYEQFPQILNEPYGQAFHTSYLNGILFKINDNQIGYRLQAAYFNQDVSFTNECEGCATGKGKLQNTAVKVGIEKSINYTRFQPYFGADIGFMVQQFDGHTYHAITTDSITARTQDNKNALLISPLVGFKLYLTPRVALSAEANFNIAYTYQKSNLYAPLPKDEGEKQTYSTIPDQTKRYRFEYFFAPVAAITLQYNFSLVNQ
ncbi:hypothetical protein [Parapedobacter tibetensis]|uniref:hypothetical protein n=1 Tax=Parapedobacter tibetensis TaxID=2972951 RepID=UPI00214DBB9A|nr:hypothetical protein [Parapedobacter tibetensis]